MAHLLYRSPEGLNSRVKRVPALMGTMPALQVPRWRHDHEIEHEIAGSPSFNGTCAVGCGPDQCHATAPCVAPRVGKLQGLSWLMQRKIVAELARASEVARQVVHGHLDVDASSDRQDEVGDACGLAGPVLSRHLGALWQS